MKESANLMNRTHLQAILLLAAVFLFHVAGLGGFNTPILVGFAAITVAALALHFNPSVHSLILFLIMAVLELLPPLPIIVSNLAPVVLSTILILPFSTTRRTLSLARPGTIDRVSWLLALLVVGVTIPALLLWANWSDNLGVGIKMVQDGFSGYPKWLVIAFFPALFALVNAAAEEAFFRGIVQESLKRTFANPWVAIVIQATTFGVGHFRGGFPNGFFGWVTGFGFAMVLGYLRQRTQGLLLPFLIHVVSDVVIGIVLVSIAL